MSSLFDMIENIKSKKKKVKINDKKKLRHFDFYYLFLHLLNGLGKTKGSKH